VLPVVPSLIPEQVEAVVQFVVAFDFVSCCAVTEVIVVEAETEKYCVAG